MISFDIDRLSEAELIELNNKIVARLRFMSDMRTHAHMLNFRIGDRVTFSAEANRTICGILTRYNRKTVTVITDDGRRWNVSPQLIRMHDPKPTYTTPARAHNPTSHDDLTLPALEE